MRPNGLGRAPESPLPFSLVLIFGNPIDALRFALEPDAEIGVLGVELDGEGLPLSPPAALEIAGVEVDIDIDGAVVTGAGNIEDCVAGGKEGADVELGNDVEPAGNTLDGAKLAARGFNPAPCPCCCCCPDSSDCCCCGKNPAPNKLGADWTVAIPFVAGGGTSCPLVAEACSPFVFVAAAGTGIGAGVAGSRAGVEVGCPNALTGAGPPNDPKIFGAEPNALPVAAAPNTFGVAVRFPNADEGAAARFPNAELEGVVPNAEEGAPGVEEGAPDAEEGVFGVPPNAGAAARFPNAP